jgi:TRAP-type C4-dicarboxylate transport system permease small subunit
MAADAQFIQEGFEKADNIGGTDIGTTDIRDVIINLVNVLLGFLGIIAVIIIIWGGFRWLTAGGNEESVATARSIITSGIIGLGIIIASFAIARFLILSLSQSTGGAVTF